MADKPRGFRDKAAPPLHDQHSSPRDAQLPAPEVKTIPQLNRNGNGNGHGNGNGADIKPLTISHTSRTIRSDPAPYRWECPCQQPPVLLATYDPGGKINIKVRDRYWHLFGFGTVQAICPRCAAEHVLDLRKVRHRIDFADLDTEDIEF
jgi:hypothetical protein